MNADEEKVVGILDRLLLLRARARRSIRTRFEERLHTRGLCTDDVLIMHRRREHSDRGTVRLV